MPARDASALPQPLTTMPDDGSQTPVYQRRRPDDGASSTPSGRLWVPDEHRRPDPETMSSEEYFEARVNAMLGELLDSEGLEKIPPLEPLVGDLLALNTLARFVGPSGTFKSFILLDMCGHVGTGRRWHGQYVRQGTVVYLVAEGEQGVRKRVRAWEQHHGVHMANVLFLPRPVQAMSPEWDVLIEVMARVRPALIGIDTQARVTQGVEENSAKEMGQVVDRMDKLRTATGACVAVVHHTGHVGEHGRGSSAVKAALQSEVKISRKGDRLSNTVLTIKSGKQKDEDQDDDLLFQLTKVSLDGEYKPDGRPVTSLVLTAAGTLPDTGPAEGTVEWIAARLDAAGVPNDYGRRRLADECQRLGFRAGNEKLNEVARMRRDRTPNRSYSAVTIPVPNPRTETGVTPDETGPGPVGGPHRTTPHGPVVPSPLLGRGPAGPSCTQCGTPLDAEWAAQGNDRHVMC
ncbi:AAA family ATPase [Streptomyces sp. S3(2020)]|uniref:AAA family ATPase n=1 Tax=Streptomyces sp. S3(2020) TaxID=2732044 RepID=UPI0014892D77|nr:AAA family ATPase [Streptomyces sp. S3(2020)]NNN34384.1 AAA family ATPase [Streptomyces sp. S3(2020)]